MTRTAPARLHTLAALAKAPTNDLPILGFKGGQAGIDHVALGDDDDVEAWRELVATENLSNQPFGPVPHHRAPQFSRRGHAKTADREGVGQDEQRAVPSVDLDAALIYLLEFGATPKAFVAPEPRHRPPIRC
jgi:hypothetical protein